MACLQTERRQKQVVVISCVRPPRPFWGALRGLVALFRWGTDRPRACKSPLAALFCRSCCLVQPWQSFLSATPEAPLGAHLWGSWRSLAEAPIGQEHSSDRVLLFVMVLLLGAIQTCFKTTPEMAAAQMRGARRGPARRGIDAVKKSKQSAIPLCVLLICFLSPYTQGRPRVPNKVRQRWAVTPWGPLLALLAGLDA